MILEAKKLAKEDQKGEGASKTSKANKGERIKILTRNKCLKDYQ